jgi:hypothetical protein
MVIIDGYRCVLQVVLASYEDQMSYEFGDILLKSAIGKILRSAHRDQELKK